MDTQRHSSVLGDTVEKLSDTTSYKLLFHAHERMKALCLYDVLKRTIYLCLTILFIGYYGKAKISKQTIHFYTDKAIEIFYVFYSDLSGRKRIKVEITQ